MNAVTGGAAIGGAGTGGRRISIARGFTGFEGDAQTKIARAVFGGLGPGITARDIYETTTPTAQCRAVIGEPDKCWVCGYDFSNASILGTAQCEHILPIVQAIMYLDLYSPKKLKSLSTPEEKADYIDYLRLEYRWAHQACNLIKKGDVYIYYNSSANKYDVAVPKLISFISKVADILLKPTRKPSTISKYNRTRLAKNRADFINQRIENIKENIYTPIVTNLNGRWAGISGEPIVAQGLDQLSAVAALLTAPMTAKGVAATAGGNMRGSIPTAFLELPKTPEQLYDSLLKRADIKGLYGGTEIFKSYIKTALDSNSFVKDELIQLYSKIKFKAETKKQLTDYINTVDNYAVSLAVTLIRKYNPSFGDIYTFGEFNQSIIDELKGTSLINTIHAVSDVAPSDIKEMVDVAASNTDENPVHTFSEVAMEDLKKDDSAAGESVSNYGNSVFNVVESNGNSPVGHRGGYRSTRRGALRRRRVTRKKRYTL